MYFWPPVGVYIYTCDIVRFTLSNEINVHTLSHLYIVMTAVYLLLIRLRKCHTEQETNDYRWKFLYKIHIPIGMLLVGILIYWWCHYSVLCERLDSNCSPHLHQLSEKNYIWSINCNSSLVAHHYWGVSVPTMVLVIAQPILIEIMKGL